jgi:hypothetical protein
MVWIGHHDCCFDLCACMLTAVVKFTSALQGTGVQELKSNIVEFLPVVSYK